MRPAPRTPSAVRALWIALTTAALLLRIAIPSGWMPMTGPAGMRLAPCPGMARAGGDPIAGGDAMAGGAMMAMPSHATHHAPEGDRAPADHPCDFAAMALALAAPLAPAILVPAPLAFAPALPAPRAGALGRGLAAPPPPSTGPPSLG